MFQISDDDRKVYAHLLNYLDRNEPEASKYGDGGHLKSIWDTNTQNEGKLLIRTCLAAILEHNHEAVKKITKELSAYKEDAVPVFLEALNEKYRYTSFYNWAPNILEEIGDYRAVQYILNHYEYHIDYGDGNRMLRKIAAREGPDVRILIADRLMEYLNADRIKPPDRYDSIVWDILDTLLELKLQNDPRLPSVLERHIAVASFASKIFHKSLNILQEIDTQKALECLKKKMNAVERNHIKEKNLRYVVDQSNEEIEKAYIAICVRNQNETELDEIPFAFIYEKPWVYYLANGKNSREQNLLAGDANNLTEARKSSATYLEKWLPEIEVVKTKYQECNKLLKQYLDFDHWGFRQTFISPTIFPTIIYDSESCRVKFDFTSGDYPYDHETTYLNVSYGRLHAPSDDVFMMWQEENCWCWHNISQALNFLDGLSPQEAVEEMRLYHKFPRIIEEFRQTNVGKEIPSMEREMSLQAAIWKQCGTNLFEIFDLQTPDLWDQYNHFVQEYYAIKGQSVPFPGHPSNDEIC